MNVEGIGGDTLANYKIIFQPGDVTVEAVEGSTIMEAIHAAGVGFDFPCGGSGKCGKCRVRITRGAYEPTVKEYERLDPKELAEGVRLACLTKVKGNLTAVLPDSKKLKHNILIDAEERKFQVEPAVKKILIEVERPSLDDQRSDWRRFKDALSHKGYTAGVEAPVHILRQLPETLRQAKHCLTALMYGREVLGIEEQDTSGTMLGMAFDIGTTTIVGYLMDLSTGKELSVVSMLNPQTQYGADVISRITFAGQEPEGLYKLHDAVIEAVNKLIGEAAEEAGVSRQNIYALSVAANACMHHLFLGITPKYIAVSPYVSAVSEPLVVGADVLKIDINQAGKVFVLPNIAGFVGADTTAVLLSTELDRGEAVKLVIDIGTNGEIALGSKTKMVACSAAAGPAFEGAQISSGMRGAAGAIDHVKFGDGISYSVIGGGSPLGICGSALLDTVAGLLESGLIDKRGRLLSPEKITNAAAQAFADRLVQHEGQPAFLLEEAGRTGHGRPILITQSDIRELQLAKGAMAAGIRVLMDTLGIHAEQIKEVLLAGAFGNYLNPHSACAIGLIPRELENKIRMIGNAAGTGSKLALLSEQEFSRTEAISSFVQFVELGSYPKFNSIFAENMYFKTGGTP